MPRYPIGIDGPKEKAADRPSGPRSTISAGSGGFGYFGTAPPTGAAEAPGFGVGPPIFGIGELPGRGVPTGDFPGVGVGIDGVGENAGEAAGLGEGVGLVVTLFPPPLQAKPSAAATESVVVKRALVFMVFS